MINADNKWRYPQHGEAMNAVQSSPLEQEDKEQYQVFVRGLPQGLTEGQLARYFERFDRVEKLTITNRKEKSLGYGFVTLKTKEGVQRVLSLPYHSIFGTPLTMEPVDPQEIVQQKKLEIQKRKIFAKGLFKKVEESDLWEYFSQFGEVESVNLNRFFNGKSKRTAFVVFRNQEDVVALLSNQELKHVLKKRKFKIYESLSKKDIQEYSKRKIEVESAGFDGYEGTYPVFRADNEFSFGIVQATASDQKRSPSYRQQSMRGSKLCIESDSDSLSEEEHMGEPGDLVDPGRMQQTPQSASKAVDVKSTSSDKQPQPSSFGKKVSQLVRSNCTTTLYSSSKPSLGAFSTARELEKTPGLSCISTRSPAPGHNNPMDHPGSTSLLARKGKPTFVQSSAARQLEKYLIPKPRPPSTSTNEITSRETAHRHEGVAVASEPWNSQNYSQQMYNLSCCQSKECYENLPRRLRRPWSAVREAAIPFQLNCPTCRENFCFRLQNMEEEANLKFNVLARRPTPSR